MALKNYILSLMLSTMASCAKSSEKLSEAVKGQKGGQKDEKEDKKSGSSPAKSESSSAQMVVSKSKKTLTVSQSNNQLSSHVINTKLAQEYADDLLKGLKDPDKKDLDNLEGVVAARALSGSPFSEVLAQTKRLITTQMKSDISSEAPDEALLHLAISAYQNHLYTMTQYLIGELDNTKNKNVKAAILNLEGVMAMKEGRLPEAFLYWRQSVGLSPGYTPALLNLGFVALSYGDFATALKYLKPLQNDWFALYGLAMAERLSGNSAKAQDLCSKILGQKSDYKPALLTCGLNQYQGLNDYKAAKETFGKIFKSSYGPKIIDEIAYKSIDRMEKDKKSTGVSNQKPSGKTNGSKPAKK